MTTWLPCPHAGDYAFLDADEVRAQWPRLHALDAEPLPRGEAALAAWALLHAGQFERAEAAGLAAGVEGLSVANRAATAHATLVEPGEKARRLAQATSSCASPRCTNSQSRMAVISPPTRRKLPTR